MPSAECHHVVIHLHAERIDVDLVLVNRDLRIEGVDLVLGFLLEHQQFGDRRLGEWVIKLHASLGDLQFDHIGTGREFFVGTEEPNAIRALAGMHYHQTLSDVLTMKSNYNQSSLDN